MTELRKELSSLVEEAEQLSQKFLEFQVKRPGELMFKSFDIESYSQFLSQKQEFKEKVRAKQVEIETVIDIEKEVTSEDSLITNVLSINVDTWLMNEHIHCLWEICCVIRYLFRTLFGIASYEGCGHFLDQHMSHLVTLYHYYVRYPDSVAELSGHTDHLRALAISDGGRYLFTGARDNCIKVWDMRDLGKPLHSWHAHSDNVIALDYHCGHLISASREPLIKVWNGHTMKLIRLIKGHSDFVVSLSFHNSGERFLSSSDDRTIREWALNTGECLRIFSGHTRRVYSVTYINDIVISGSTDKSIRVWNGITMKEDHVLKDDIVAAIGEVCCNCDASLIAGHVYNHVILIYHWPELTLHSTIHLKSFRGCFHPWIPHILAVGDRSDYEVKLMDVRNGECIKSFAGHTGRIPRLSFTPDGYRLVTISDDMTTRIWNVSFLFDL